jgi:hypothetical protein
MKAGICLVLLSLAGLGACSIQVAADDRHTPPAKPLVCLLGGQSYSIGANVPLEGAEGTRSGTFAKATCQKCKPDGTWSDPASCN